MVEAVRLHQATSLQRARVRLGAAAAATRRGASRFRRELRAFRRTRPFWGGLWLALAGIEIVYWTQNPIALVVGGGWGRSAGYVIGGGLVLLGVAAWFTPLYRALFGILGFLLGLGAFVGANLGGFLLGSVLAILGGSMVWGWGEKQPRRPRRGRRAAGS
ncbi:hypothetical protein EFK50_03610 [Nocardioides marmoriginsengisoli]|uniref:Uncharacterized protein n=1 Tax=Nocardioides marmoriginsengisoli TaxID=661483 RepID=A0A3N0CPU7_9ACTN|nr:hypothetical protein EFK50_03610 [Nocardioides marmoriginsengisoli]